MVPAPEAGFLQCVVIRPHVTAAAKPCLLPPASTCPVPVSYLGRSPLLHICQAELSPQCRSTSAVLLFPSIAVIVGDGRVMARGACPQPSWGCHAPHTKCWAPSALPTYGPTHSPCAALLIAPYVTPRMAPGIALCCLSLSLLVSHCVKAQQAGWVAGTFLGHSALHQLSSSLPSLPHT